jgi:hypothetical protein
VLEIGEYLHALWAHWVALMSGVIGLLVGVGLRVGKRFSQKISKWPDVPDFLFIGVGVVCLFMAGYGAWQDKHKALVSLQERLKSPEFIGRIGSVSTGEMNGEPFIAVGGLIYNPTGPPSGIIDWKMKIKFPNGKELIGIPPVTSGKDYEIPIPSGQKVILRANEYWPKSSQNPIMTGGVLEGWIFCIFPELDVSEAYKEHALVVIEVNDAVANKTHRFTEVLREQGIHLPPGQLPKTIFKRSKK